MSSKIILGKENPKQNLLHKPLIHQGPRFTRSNSGVPSKGTRSSSPFEFTRFALNDEIKVNKGSFGCKDLGVRSVSSGRRSFNGDCQKIESFRGSDERLSDKVGNAELGVRSESSGRENVNGVHRKIESFRGSDGKLRDKVENVELGSKVRSESSGRRSVNGDHRKIESFSGSDGRLRDKVGNVDLGLKVKSESSGRGSVNGDHQKIESFRGSDERLKDKVGNLGLGLKENCGEMRDFSDTRKDKVRSVSSGRGSVNGDRVLGMSRGKVESFRGLNVKSSEKIVKDGENLRKSEENLSFRMGQQKVGSFRGLEKGGRLERSVSNGRRSVSGDRDIGMGQAKVVSFKVLDVKPSQKVIKNGEFGRISEGGLGTNQQKNVGSRDLNVENINGVVKEKECYEKSRDIIEKSEPGLKRSGDLGDRVHYTKETSGKVSNALRGSERLKQKGLVEENASVRGVNKYPSKLHEKLAFLEGKVKRIASDIKKTKEMLDLNNPDSSKVVLSDIQEKISGIEKAMGDVADSDKQINVLEKVENKKKVTDNVSADVERKEVENMKSSVKGLNCEELEARLFPHHKLLRDRTSLKVSSTSTEKVGFEAKVEEKVSTQDESLVEVEFLASLVKEQSKFTMRGESDGGEVSKSQENMDIVEKEDNIILTSDETFNDFGESPIIAEIIIDEDGDDNIVNQFSEIGHKTSTCGWFVADGEAALLAHDDGSCTYYDIANSEVKSEYKPPIGISQNTWRDCWIVRAPGPDGSSGRYVVAASAGNSLESGFCSWDFYNKDVRAFHIEDGTTNNSRTALAPLPNYPSYRRNSFSNIIASENHHWWYKPCGPLIVSTASNLKGVCIYDIRDGEQIMRWEVQKPVLSMDYSSPLQWRNRGKVVIAESECVSLWDVSSLTPQALQSISTSGRRVCALHVNNTDAELGGGVRQRVSSSEAEGHDGVFCTADSINVLDFRNPSGIGLKISKIGVNVQSLYSRGDSIFLGCNNSKSASKDSPCPQIQHFSLRKQKMVSNYSFPESNAHPHYTAITQVWGNSNLVMGVCGLGLFVFDALKDEGARVPAEYCSMQKVRETIGPNDLYSPSFDYLSSRVLLISRDRPALWRYLS